MNQALIVTDLTKTYTSNAGISHVTFEVQAGEIFGLLGPNGAGKTTTMRTIATMLRPTSGHVQVAGYDSLISPALVRRHLGVLTTEVGLYERFSGRENLAYSAKLYGLSTQQTQQRIEELVTLLDMAPFIDSKTGTYSTGMKQKLALARAIIHSPQVMMLDEPTIGLDVLAAQTVLNFIQDAKKQGISIVFSTHNMLEADRLCDRIAIMRFGRIIAIDTPASLKKQTGQDNLSDAFLAIISQPEP